MRELSDLLQLNGLEQLNILQQLKDLQQLDLLPLRMEWQILEQYHSKKNAVFLLCGHSQADLLDNQDGGRYVLKIFRTAEMENELRWLRGLHNAGVSVPKIYYSDENVLLEEYIGPTFYEAFTQAEDKQLEVSAQKPIILALCDWLRSFYAYARNGDQQWTMGDVNLRNFLVKNNQVYGIDFEDCRIGCIAEDVGKICAFALTYQPAFTEWKRQFVRQLMEVLTTGLGLDSAQVQSETMKELKAISERRGLPIVNLQSELRLIEF